MATAKYNSKFVKVIVPFRAIFQAAFYYVCHRLCSTTGAAHLLDVAISQLMRLETRVLDGLATE